MVWHQLWSASSVVTTRSASAAPGERSLTVTRAVREPAPRARRGGGVRAPRPALGGDADDEPAALRRKGRLEGLDRLDTRLEAFAGQPGGQDEGRRLGALLARAPADDADRGTRGGRPAPRR